MSNELTVGSDWQHKKGDLYRVVVLANMQSTKPEEYPPTVVYQARKDGTIWSRPISRWFGSFTRIA